MKTHRLLFRSSLLCSLALLGWGSLASAQWVTQTIPLQAGWNAVYLRVQPVPATCDDVFANTPVTNVCRYNARIISAQFGTDPTQLWKRPDEWLSWFPRTGNEADTRTLNNLVGAAAYLIQASTACTLSLKGRPVLPRIEWVPGQANLVGFQVSPYPELRPTFAEFFHYEPAIDGEQQLQANLIGTIGANGIPTSISARTTREMIAPGEAYWVQAQKLSDYVGPLRVSTSDPDGLIFGEDFNELILQVRNVCDTSAPPITVTLRHVNSEAPPTGAASLAGAVPLLFADRTATNWTLRAWPTDQSQIYTLAAGEVMTLRLAVNRSAMPTNTPANTIFQSLLQVSGSSGTFIQVPLSAAYASGNDQLAPFPYGLWVGEAYINEVSCVRFSTNAGGESASAPLPAGGGFPLRLILHANCGGTNRLLASAVIAVAQDANNNLVNRIYTDAAHVPASATIVARVSSAAFGWIPPVGLSPPTNSPGPGFLNLLHGSYTVGYNDPLNPFKHVYHPDHDNKNSGGDALPEGAESFTISNHVTLTWNTVPDPVLGATLWNPGETVSGTYQHVIGNIRHVPITNSGPFTLKRVSRVGRIE